MLKFHRNQIVNIKLGDRLVRSKILGLNKQLSDYFGSNVYNILPLDQKLKLLSLRVSEDKIIPLNYDGNEIVSWADMIHIWRPNANTPK